MQIEAVILDIDAVILDMDGLMLDTEGLYKAAWQKASSQLGFVLNDSFYFTLLGRTNAAGEMALRERFFQNIPIAVATPSDREYEALSLRAGGLDAGRFAHVVTGEQVEKGKPAPDIYLEAARRLRVHPARALAIEDSDAGILSATPTGVPGSDIVASGDSVAFHRLAQRHARLSRSARRRAS